MSLDSRSLIKAGHESLLPEVVKAEDGVSSKAEGSGDAEAGVEADEAAVLEGDLLTGVVMVVVVGEPRVDVLEASLLLDVVVVDEPPP